MTFGARPIELSRIWSWFKALMLALHRDWSGLPSGSSHSPGHTLHREHLAWRCSKWISTRKVGGGYALVRSDLFERR